MDLERLLGELASGTLAPLDAPTEGDWHAIWQREGIGRHEPVITAALGGARADRLAWVFLSGYQACIRHTFPALTARLDDGDQWCSFVNTEDAEGTLPGTKLASAGDAQRLSGWKTWLAASDHVAQLLVSLREPSPWRYAVVPRDAAGVTIETGPPRRFLPELAQGRVEFDATPVEADALFADDDSYAQFGIAEGTYVRVALNAMMLSTVRQLDAPVDLTADAAANLAALAAVAALPLRSAAASAALLGIDRHTRTLAEAFADLIAERAPALHDRWRRDQRLIAMAVTGIERRGAEAFGAVVAS